MIFYYSLLILFFVGLIQGQQVFILLVRLEEVFAVVGVPHDLHDLHDDLEDLEVAFPALAGEVAEHDSCLGGELVVGLFDVDVSEARSEVAFQRCLGVAVRDINVDLVFLALVRR